MLKLFPMQKPQIAVLTVRLKKEQQQEHYQQH
jgi:hypothetical protein